MYRLSCLFLVLGGCAWFQKAADRVEGVLDPLVAVGVVSILEPPETDVLRDADLSALGFDEGVGATVFLADARSVADLGNAPLVGEDVAVTGCGTTLGLEGGGDGSYLLVPPSDLDGCAGPGFELRRQADEEDTVLPITVPPAVDIAVPAYHTAGQPLVLDFSEAGYDASLVVVVDAQSGELRFSNEPEGIVAWYQFLTGRQDTATVTVPASAFDDDRAYALGIAGFERTRNVEVDNANEALSVVAGGRMRVHPVLTYDEADTGW